MKQSEIKPGASYYGRGQGEPWRKVLRLFYSLLPSSPWRVEYGSSSGERKTVPLSTFARWAEGEVKP